jgi:hypothetical protein
MIASYVSSIGATPKLVLRNGTIPGACGSVDAGTMLAILTLPSTWQTSASGITTIASGPWTGTGATAGTITHYRLKDTSATSSDNTGTTHEQGTVSTSGADINVDNLVVAVGQTISISSWNRTQGGA